MLGVACTEIPSAVIKRSKLCTAAPKIGTKLLAALGCKIDSRMATHYGAFIVEVVETLEIIKTLERFEDGERYSAFYLYPRNRTILADMASHSISERLVQMPIDSPVEDWETGFHKRGLDLIRRGNHKQLKLLSIEKHPLVFKAINKAQNIGWKINNPLLDLYTKFCENEKLSTYEDSYAFDHFDPKINNASRKGKLLESISIGKIADMVKDITFYHIYALDFRGRVYPRTAYLHEQSSDRAKALLRFAKGKTMQPEDLSWLAIYTANCYGHDKSTLATRIRWVNMWQNELVKYADDPIKNRSWIKADKPWSFLACCIQWKKIQEGDMFCDMPIFIDGSNNGTQHLAALSNDNNIASQVNLVYQAKVGDIYKFVADIVWDQLDDSEAGQYWKNIPKAKDRRKICKRPCMTLGYGGTRTGFGGQVHQDSKKMGGYYAQKSFGYSGYLGDLIYNVCRGNKKKGFDPVLVGPAMMLDLFETLTKKSVTEAQMTWVVPVTNFPVIQAYVSTKNAIVPVKYLGKRRQLSIRIAEDRKIDKRKNKVAASPNIVHSFDAAHLQMTVTNCDFQTVTVHDSFGCLPSDMGKMYTIVREQFVRFYNQDPLYQLLEQHNCLEMMPDRGTLDINEVLKSEYAFI